ncbi:hypothetical protein C6P40_000382 [Pichia californica]|uniref:Uncharacterized protein n=1 Tax=Pichia californica TaxID=460514 RepID=A0A9P6WND2_9ASCO|nr:hypothetical protein C6P40_000382 [[Candida] californica]
MESNQMKSAGVLLVAIPLGLTTTFCRPSFANAINNHLIQEEMEAKRQHNYKTDFYQKSDSHDKMLSDYAEKGKGRARNFIPSSEL